MVRTETIIVALLLITAKSFAAVILVNGSSATTINNAFTTANSGDTIKLTGSCWSSGTVEMTLTRSKWRSGYES